MKNINYSQCTMPIECTTIEIKKHNEYFVEEKVKHAVHAMCAFILIDSGVTLEQVLSENRKKEIKEMRHICIYLTREFFNLKFKQISTVFSKDHSTCIHSVKTVISFRNSYKKYNSMIIETEEKVTAYLTATKNEKE